MGQLCMSGGGSNSPSQNKRLASSPQNAVQQEFTVSKQHMNDITQTMKVLERDHAWPVDQEVVDAMTSVDLPRYREVLDSRRVREPRWDANKHGDHLIDRRVQHLAEGGYVFENLSVYAVLAQLLYPAVAEAKEPRILDVGCGTGFLTSVMGHLAAPRGGSVVAIDIFDRQVEHTQATLGQCRPDLLPLTSFHVGSGWEFKDPSGQLFNAIAVAAQADEVPQGLVEQLAPNGRIVFPFGPVVPIDSNRPDRFNPYWLIEKGEDGSIAFSGRAGPISVNFLPFLK